MRAVLLGITLFLTGFAPAAQAQQHRDSVVRPSKLPLLADSSRRWVRIERIFITGNRRTHDRIILRELSIKPGELVIFSELPPTLDLDRKKLINTRLFNTVDFRTLEMGDNTFDLLIDVKERWYTFPSPILDLADRNFNEWWETYDHDLRRINYGLRLYQFNMRGRNETLRFIAQFGFLKRFDLSYRIPNLDREQKHGLAFDADFSEAKNVAFRTLDHRLDFLQSDRILRTTQGVGFTYFFRNSFFETHNVRFDYRSNRISDTLVAYNPNYFGADGRIHQEYASLSYQFTSEHRDYIPYPLHGYLFTAQISKSGLTAGDDLNKAELLLNYARFFDLKKNFYLSNHTAGYFSTPEDLPYFNLGALGYRKQFIRGYEVYVIEGPAYFMNKTTLRKRILSRNYHWAAMPIEQFRHIPLQIYFKIYGDAAYVKNYPDYEIGSRLSNKWLSSIGGGFDLVSSYDAVFRFEYTFNAEGENGFFFHIRKEF